MSAYRRAKSSFGYTAMGHEISSGVVGSAALALALCISTTTAAVPSVTRGTVAKCGQLIEKMHDKPSGQWTPGETAAFNDCQLTMTYNRHLSLASKALALRKPLAFFAIGTKALAQAYAFGGDGLFQDIRDLEYVVAQGNPDYEPLMRKAVILHTNQTIFPVLFRDGTIATYPPNLIVVVSGEAIGVVRASEYDAATR